MKLEKVLGKNDRGYRKLLYDKQLNRQGVCSLEKRRLNRFSWWRLVKSWMIWKWWIAQELGAIIISSNEINWQFLNTVQELLFHIINNYTVEVIVTRCGCQNPQWGSKEMSDKLTEERVITHKVTKTHPFQEIPSLQKLTLSTEVIYQTKK